MIARIRKSMEEKEQGFTLIELLVVMIIIGILAAIAIPVFLNQRKSAVDSSMKSDLRTAATAIETYFVDNQSYPTSAVWTSTVSLSIQKDPQTTLTYTPDGTGTGFCIEADRASGAQPGTGKWYYDSDKGGLLDNHTACS